jgi:hypothetical protein
MGVLMSTWVCAPPDFAEPLARVGVPLAPAGRCARW